MPAAKVTTKPAATKEKVTKKPAVKVTKKPAAKVIKKPAKKQAEEKIAAPAAWPVWEKMVAWIKVGPVATQIVLHD